MREAARSSLKRVNFDRKLRLLGIRAGSLVKACDYTLSTPEDSRAAEPSTALFADLEP